MKKGMNIKSLLLSFMAMLMVASAYAQDNVIDEVVWVVGDEAIWKSEVEAARLEALYNGTKFDRDPYCVIPEQIAVNKLYLHQAALDSIEVSETDVIRQADQTMNNYITSIGSQEKLEEYFNKTYDEMADKLYSLYASGSWLDYAKILKTERLNTGRNAHYLMVEYNGRIIEACISYSTCIGFRFVGANTEFVFSRKYSPTSSKHWSLFRNHK